jgi:hypothetical protein
MSALRHFVSTGLRNAQFGLRSMTGTPRAMPDFIVIGAQKSGTSSMFAYLKQHRQILRPAFKEIYYFDRHYQRGLSWYGRNFPSRAAIERMNDRLGRPHLTFEATATYIFDRDTPDRIARDIETRKFVALLRDPVDRAISAYWHARRMSRETRSLQEAMNEDRERLETEMAFEEGRGPAPSGAPPKPRYLRRGIYHESVRRWLGTFAPENLLVLQSETMFADPRAVMARTFAFLDLDPADDIRFEAQNVGTYAGTDPDSDAEMRRWLAAFYRPYNDELNRAAGCAMTW